MKKNKEILNKYFEEARKSKELFSHDEARDLLENHIASKSSSPNNKFWKTITRMKPMNIITSAAASIAIIGMISFGIFDSDHENKDNNESIRNAADNSTEVVNYDSDKSIEHNANDVKKPAEEIALNDNGKEKYNAEETNEQKIDIPANLPETEKVNIKGINAIQLSENELANLGIEIIKNDSYSSKNPYGLAYCDKWIRDEPVRTVVMKNWGVVMDSDAEIPDASNCISPRIITDNKGNRRVEVFDDDDLITTKTFYNRDNYVHKDPDGNEVINIKTNKTTRFIHSNENKDISEEVTTDMIVDLDEKEIKDNSKPMYIQTSVVIDDSNHKVPQNVYTVVSKDSKNQIILENDSIRVINNNIIDNSRMKELGDKIKKYKFIWHEEEFEELKKQLEDMKIDQEVQKEIHEKIKEMNKTLRKKFEGMNEATSDSVRFFIFPDSSGCHINVPSYDLFLDSLNIKLDSLKNMKFFRLDTTMKFFFRMDTSRFKHNIEMEEMLGPDKDIQKHHKFMFANKLNRLEKDINNYIKVNKLIPIEVPIEENGDGFSFILWFDPTQDFLEKLPARVSYLLEDELEALRNTSDVCATPVKGDEAILDIWRSCSGAIENLHVFPNPADGNVNIQFNLTEKRDLRISLHDLYGKSIKTIDNYKTMAPGLIRKNIMLGDLAPGMYLIALESKSGEQAVQRIIVE